MFFFGGGAAAGIKRKIRTLPVDWSFLFSLLLIGCHVHFPNADRDAEAVADVTGSSFSDCFLCFWLLSLALGCCNACGQSSKHWMLAHGLKRPPQRGECCLAVMLMHYIGKWLVRYIKRLQAVSCNQSLAAAGRRSTQIGFLFVSLCSQQYARQLISHYFIHCT